MTDPAGRVLLSYSRRRAEEAGRLLAALHDVGVPTWQDVEDLGPERIAEALRRELESEATAGAVLLVTPEVATSEFILRIEAPLILRRAARDERFFVLGVVAGGLDYEGAAQVLSRASTFEDAGQWNLHRVESERLDDEEAGRIARRVLRRRLEALHASSSAGEPLQVELYTRPPVAPRPGAALLLDWRHRFEGLPALPAAAGLGAAFLRTRRIPLAWWQYRDGEETLWSLAARRTGSGFEARFQEREPGARDLAVFVSVADEVEPAVVSSQAELPPFRALVSVEKAGEPPHELASAGEAADVALVLERALRKARQRFSPIDTVHLFMAVPAGLAVLVGQLLNTWDRVQTYELEGRGETARYHPAALLRPNR